LHDPGAKRRDANQGIAQRARRFVFARAAFLANEFRAGRREPLP
jgi:hypothetical protein